MCVPIILDVLDYDYITFPPGLQFFVPSTAWYCKLCDQFIGDLHCASAHLKSIVHSKNYTVSLTFIYCADTSVSKLMLALNGRFFHTLYFLSAIVG